MIAYLRGQIKYKTALPKKDSFIILDVGGVGYRVFVFDRLAKDLTVGQELEVFVYTQVAETALDLYGLVAMEELRFFEILISLPGIGPKSAFSILQKAKVADLKAAAGSGNATVLNQISGIGQKTAEKIVAGLKDKIGGLQPTAAEAGNEGFGEALEALVGLGYGAAQSREVLAHTTAKDTGGKIKEALKILGQKH